MWLLDFVSSSCHNTILFQIPTVIIVPPTFRPSNNVDSFHILWPQLFYSLNNRLYGILEWCDIRNSWCVDFTNVVNEHTNKLLLFITVFDKCLFLSIDKFLKNEYINYEEGMIGDEPLIQIDRMRVKFIRLISKKYEIND